MYLDVANNKIIGVNVSSYTEKGVSYPIKNINVSDEIYNAYMKDETSVIYYNDEIILNPNYEAEQELKERERIAKLFLTGADVERGIYQAKGMDFDDIIALVEHLSKGELDLETGEVINKGIDIDIKALKIELKANHFYRGNAYVNAVGALLGFTSEQLDMFFKFNDYTYLIPPVIEVEDEDTTNITI